MIQWLIVRLLLRQAMKFQTLDKIMNQRQKKPLSQFVLIIFEWMPAKGRHN